MHSKYKNKLIDSKIVDIGNEIATGFEHKTTEISTDFEIFIFIESMLTHEQKKKKTNKWVDLNFMWQRRIPSSIVSINYIFQVQPIYRKTFALVRKATEKRNLIFYVLFM